MDFSVSQIINDTLAAANARRRPLIIACIPAFAGFALMAFFGVLMFGPDADFTGDPQSSNNGRYFFRSFFVFILSGLMFMKSMVNCHRVYMLEESLSLGEVFKWHRYDTQFLLTSLKLGLVYIGIVFLASFLLIPFVSGQPGEASATGAFFWLMVLQLALAYLASRLCVLLPAAATESRLTLSEGWAMTRPHQLKFFVLMGIIPFLTSVLLGTLPTEEVPLMGLVVYPVWCMVAVLELGLLSFSYLRVQTTSEEQQFSF